MFAVGLIAASSLTVFAATCPKGGDHTFGGETRIYEGRTNEDHHTHKDPSNGLIYNCTSYVYHYTVVQECSKCKGKMTIPNGHTQLVHIPN